MLERKLVLDTDTSTSYNTYIYKRKDKKNGH